MKRAFRVISNSTPQTDHQLLQRCQAGQSDAFETLVRRYQARLFSVAHRLMKDRDLASELVQESLFRAYKNISKHSGTGSVKGWFTRITVNTCLNEIRKRQRLVFSEHSMETWLATDQRDDPAQKAQAQELRGLVKREVQRLTPRRQAVLALAALGYSYDEMSEALELAVTQVKSELFRARKKLKETLKEYRE